MRFVFRVAILLVAFSVPVQAESQSTNGNHAEASPVGMPARLEQIVLPGSELVAKPIEASGPLIVRIVETFPHGSDFRYDIEYYGLEPGKYDLVSFLERKDGSSVDGLSSISVEITTMLPDGQVMPNDLDSEIIKGFGGYHVLMTVAGIAWFVGLLAIVFVGRKKAGTRQEAERVESLADRLRPVVQQAISGEIAVEKLAELEMMLVAYWSKRLGLNSKDAAEIIPALRNHSDAGPLLTQLEVWLHQPDTGADVDVARLMEPYRNLPSDALESA